MLNTSGCSQKTYGNPALKKKKPLAKSADGPASLWRLSHTVPSHTISRVSSRLNHTSPLAPNSAAIGAANSE